jgi:acyl-CoA reductase-like NAD-dependent aldehyde dehydrogenase
MSAFANSGQVCISLQRLYVHDAIADAFLERFVAATRALKIGNPLDRDCDVGPMISDEAADRAETWIREALDEGARALTDVRREGRMLWPVVLTDTRPDMKVMCREAFAPLVSVVRYRSFEDGLAMLADSPYGLQAGIYTNDLKKAFRAGGSARRRRRDGERHVDLPRRSHAVRRQPHERHRARRRSGFAIEEMTNLKLV